MPYDKYSLLFRQLIDKINTLSGVPKDYIRDVFRSFPLAILQLRVGESVITPVGKFYWKQYKPRYRTIPTEESGFGVTKGRIILKFKPKRTLLFTEDSPLWDYLTDTPRPRELGDFWKHRKNKRPYAGNKSKAPDAIKIKKGAKMEEAALQAGISMEEVRRNKVYAPYQPNPEQPSPVTVSPMTVPTQPVVSTPPTSPKNPLETRSPSIFKSLLRTFAEINIEDEDSEESDGNEEFDE